MKRGFSLVAAIFFIILVATTALTALSIAAMTARDVNNIYSKEQALLLAQSATEFAVMAMQAHNYPDPTNPAVARNCLETINLSYPSAVAGQTMYNITVNLYYLDPNLGCGSRGIGLTPFRNADGSNVASNVVTTHMALVDVTVRSTDLLGAMPIIYNRRTLQKP